MNRVKAILIAIDQLFGAIITGWPDLTISAAAWMWEQQGKRAWPRRWIDRVALLFGDKDHCRESFESELRGLQLPPEARQSDPQ